MRTKSSKKVLAPKIVVHFYLAEDLRQEANGKVSAIGLYTDRVVIVGLSEDDPEPDEAKPILLKSLGFLFNISGFTEATSIGLSRMTDSGLKPLVLAKEYPAPGEGRSMNLMALMEPCAISAFGKRKIVVSVGDSNHEFEYEIRRGTVPRANVVNEAPQTDQVAAKKSRASDSKSRKAKSQLPTA